MEEEKGMKSRETMKDKVKVKDGPGSSWVCYQHHPRAGGMLVVSGTLSALVLFDVTTVSWLLLKKKNNLFIFGCAWSSWLCEGFL